MATDATNEFGRLVIDGSIDLTQFWPSGSSDADTTKILVDVRPGSFRYFAPGARRAQKLTCYDKAYVLERGKPKYVLRNGAIVVRVQGVDAPELHYSPQYVKALGSLAGKGVVKHYRQRQAETATVLLAAELQRRAGRSSKVAVTVVSMVKHAEGPSSAIDMYGRVVADLYVKDRATPVNQWILANGLAIVAVYDGMSASEIDGCIDSWKRGRKVSVRRFLSRRTLDFDPTLIERRRVRNSVPAIEDEKRLGYILPKLYRRQTTWWAYREVGAHSLSLREYLGTHGARDKVYSLSEFRRRGVQASLVPFADCFDDQRLLKNPAAMVFTEGGGDLYERPPGAERGVKIVEWR